MKEILIKIGLMLLLSLLGGLAFICFAVCYVSIQNIMK
jgi:hypothetical protein